MDEMLLNELYGDVQYEDADEMEKIARAELVEAVAAENDIDLDSMDDYELEKFAEYVLYGEDEDDEYDEYDDIYDEYDEYDDIYGDDYTFQEKVAEADTMGRIMARAYYDEQMALEDELYGYDDYLDDDDDPMYKVAEALLDIDDAWEDGQLELEEDFEIAGYEALEKRAEWLLDLGEPALAYIEALDGEGFAKEAELRACEILLSEGIDPETFEYVYPEYVKLASFPDSDEANSYVAELALDQYNEDLDYAALHIINNLFDNYDYL